MEPKKFNPTDKWVILGHWRQPDGFKNRWQIFVEEKLKILMFENQKKLNQKNEMFSQWCQREIQSKTRIIELKEKSLMKDIMADKSNLLRYTLHNNILV